MPRRIAILGAGRLGESLVRGFLSSGWRTPDELAVTVRHEERLAELRERYGVSVGTSNTEAVQGAALVIVAVKPQDMSAVLAEIAGTVTAEQVILSVAAGVTTTFIEKHLSPQARVVRAMPNAPALVHEGIAGIAAGSSPGTRTSRWPKRRSATSAPSFASRRATSTPSRPFRAPGQRTSPCSPRR